MVDTVLLAEHDWRDTKKRKEKKISESESE